MYVPIIKLFLHFKFNDTVCRLLIIYVLQGKVMMKKEILLDRNEAAKYLGVSPFTLRTWATRKFKNVPFRKVGRRCQYLKEDLDKYIKSKELGR